MMIFVVEKEHEAEPALNVEDGQDPRQLLGISNWSISGQNQAEHRMLAGDDDYDMHDMQ